MAFFISLRAIFGMSFSSLELMLIVQFFFARLHALILAVLSRVLRVCQSVCNALCIWAYHLHMPRVLFSKLRNIGAIAVGSLLIHCANRQFTLLSTDLRIPQ